MTNFEDILKFTQQKAKKEASIKPEAKAVSQMPLNIQVTSLKSVIEKMEREGKLKKIIVDGVEHYELGEK